MQAGLTLSYGGAPLWLWLSFHISVGLLLLADFFLTRDALPQQQVERRSYWLTMAWVMSALLFGWIIARALAPRFGLEYLTGYGIEESLSIDNLFVFLVLFRAFGLALAEQRRVLFLGVIGAIAMRAAMIFAGLGLLRTFSWMNYIFGAILLYTAWHLLKKSRENEHEQPPRGIEWLLSHFPLASRFRAKPLLLALIAIELTDAVFATDSVPAVLAISHHPFVVYSSNIFAVLGLRSLYFSLAAALEKLHKLRYGLAVVLAFMGAKMILAEWLVVPTWISLAVLALAVGISAAWSLLSPAPAPTGP